MKKHFYVLFISLIVTSCDYVIYSTGDLRNTSDYFLKLNYSDSAYFEYTISGEPHYISYDEYNHSIVHYYVGTYNLFPVKIDSGLITYFAFCTPYSDSAGNHGIMEFYLNWKMDSEKYDSEKERLSSIYFEHTKKGAILTNNLFVLPAYVLIYNSQSEFCYAIIDESTFTITYIYFFDIKSYDNLVFDEKLMPKKLLSESNFSGQYVREEYNMFAFYGS